VEDCGLAILEMTDWPEASRKLWLHWPPPWLLTEDRVPAQCQTREGAVPPPRRVGRNLAKQGCLNAHFARMGAFL
jgi:hypothetical protein